LRSPISCLFWFSPPFAGVLADRRDRVWTIRITQWIGCAQASVLAILVVYDVMTIEMLFALVLMLGIANGVAQPSRLALIATLVDRQIAGLGTGHQFSRVQSRAVYRHGAGRAGDRGNRNRGCFRG
jgi:MFS family permease